MKTIHLTQGKVALVDDEDYERVSQYKWCAYKPKGSKTYYACRGVLRSGVQTTEQMHRFILKLSRKSKTDHRDGDGLNNQKFNLRRATNAQNGRNRGKQVNNRSGYKGVFPSHPNEKRWMARLRRSGRPIHLGTFATREEAARAYDAGVRKYHGDFARLNFPEAS